MSASRQEKDFEFNKGAECMNEEPSHYALNPSSDLVKRASKVTKAESARKGELKFHMTEDMRRLSTPWSISSQS